MQACELTLSPGMSGQIFFGVNMMAVAFSQMLTGYNMGSAEFKSTFRLVHEILVIVKDHPNLKDIAMS
jgi:hypothetical protein